MVPTEQVKYVARLGAISPSSICDYNSTLTILDWDDTLICTSYLKDNVGSKHETNRLCDAISKAVCSLLTKCLQHGKVVIITNAALSWVNFSISQFFPSVVSLLDRIPVISARDIFSFEHPDDPSTWKRKAFRSLNFSEGNIISVGDSNLDLEALLTLKPSSAQYLLKKTVKFTKRPSPDELIRQLILLTSRFGTIAASAQPLRVSMVVRCC